VATPLEARLRAGEVPQTDPDLRFLVAARTCDARGRRPRDETNPGPSYRPWDEFYAGDQTVVFGHWSQRGLVRTARVRGIDTGCVWGGSLTAWIAEEDRFVQVSARRVYAAF